MVSIVNSFFNTLKEIKNSLIFFFWNKKLINDVELKNEHVYFAEINQNGVISQKKYGVRKCKTQKFKF